MSAKDFMNPDGERSAKELFRESEYVDAGYKDFMNPKATPSARELFRESELNVSRIESIEAKSKELKESIQARTRNIQNNTIENITGKTEGLFAHDTGNTTPKENFDDLKIRFDFQPNLLDNYDVVTYHWKLYIASPEASSTGRVFNIADQTIIAETGVTDIAIDNVHMTSVTVPSISSGTGTTTNITFDLFEPAGAQLIDQLFYQSIALGIGTWTNMPMYLELKFKGRNPDTEEPEAGEIGSLGGVVWFWAIKITSIKVNVTNVGAKYEVVALKYNEFAQANSVASIQHNVTLESIETFGDAMAALQTKLNDDQGLNLISNYSIADTYRIVVDPKLAVKKITPPDKNKNPRRADGYETWGNKSASFQTGTGINSIIDTLLSNSKEVQKDISSTDTAGGQPKPSDVVNDQMKKLWRVVTETRPLRFDPRRQDLAKEFTIYIIEYDIGVLDSNVPNPDTGAAPSIASERRRMATYLKKKILRKKYNYIFTGVNDQVLNFDITINNAYTAALARTSGIVQTASLYDMGVVAQDTNEALARAQQAVAKAISLQNNAKNSSESITALKLAQDAIGDSNVPPLEQSKLNILLNNYLPNAKPADRTAYMTGAREFGVNPDGTIATEQIKRNAVNLAKPVRERITEKQYNFISNVDPTSPESLKAFKEFSDNTRRNARPVARAVSMQDRQVGLGVEGNSDTGLQQLSSMFSVALHSGMDTSFANITLTIKGDPFWLYPAPISTEGMPIIFNTLLRDVPKEIDNLKNSHKRTEFVNIDGTDNFILLRFRSPRIYNADDNPDAADTNAEVETLSGVFRITSVESRFEKGRFVQDLKGIIDPNINVLNFNKEIEMDAKRQDNKIDVSGLTKPNNLLPPLAIKDQKIASALTERIPGIPTTRILHSGPGQTTIETDSGEGYTITRATPEKTYTILKESNIPTLTPSILPGLPDTYT